MPSKIAFVSTMEIDPWGGSEELWGQAAARLMKQGIEVGVNVKWWPDEARQVRELRAAGAEVATRRPKNRLERARARVLGGSEFGWLDGFRPGLVVISQGSLLDGIFWAEACLERKIPYVLIVQAAAELWWPDDYQSRYAARLYQSALACFFVSQGNLALVTQQLAARLENASVVANPFNVAADVALGWPDQSEGLRLCCVGRLAPEAKGQDLILEVLRQQKWRERAIQVSFAGSGRSAGSLKILSELYGLGDKVSFKGFVSSVEAVWQEHHALLLPSRFEGLPLAVVEAMLCARPCIVTDVAGNRELIDDNVNGFLAVAPTVGCLDEVLERAWTRRDEWQQIGKNAAVTVRERVPADPIGVFATQLLGLSAAA